MVIPSNSLNSRNTTPPNPFKPITYSTVLPCKQYITNNQLFSIVYHVNDTCL
eukprot:m.245703 g.245703  ORF g.245703 m.245703 type:complete len:52 (-) comp63600_c0_seq1:126-281(-)